MGQDRLEKPIHAAQGAGVELRKYYGSIEGECAAFPVK